mmetsp:Transcript_93725/g.303489  ORF Transcript_93725/g.303489 Transcript_93725/m.303489 type:complete len:283 (+) Transcript_93725:2355-3203(+)
MQICSSVGMSHTIVSDFGGRALTSRASSLPAICCGRLSGCCSPANRPTCNFVLRNKCGLNNSQSCSERCCLRPTAYSLAFRKLPWLMGSLKRFVKVAWLPRSPGCAKSIRDHKSCKAFCTGVPVSNNRHRARICRTLFPNAVVMFLILCASSHMTTSQAPGPEPLPLLPPTCSSTPSSSTSSASGGSSTSSSSSRSMATASPPPPAAAPGPGERRPPAPPSRMPALSRRSFDGPPAIPTAAAAAPRLAPRPPRPEPRVFAPLAPRAGGEGGGCEESAWQSSS